MTPAETLTAAAEKLRGLAGDATPGPWVDVAGAFGDPYNGPDHMRVTTQGYTNDRGATTPPTSSP